MTDFDKLCASIKNKMLDSAPDIFDKLKKAAAKKLAEQLINELNGIPSNCGKLVFEQSINVPILRKVA